LKNNITMKVVIMQPAYLPWLGYFDLMDQSDTFVVLDNVQFEKRSWQQRNRIKTKKGELWLTIPVISKGRYNQKINEVEIDDSQSWAKKHLKTIERNYAHAKYYKNYINFFKNFYSEKITKLVDFTIPIILYIKDVLGINSQIVKASELNVNGSKVELLIDICHKIKADEYLSPIGSKEYIEENNLFKKEGIRLEYHHYIHPKYSQLWGDFIPYLSAIDLLLNEGGDSLSIIKSGRNKNKI